MSLWHQVSPKRCNVMFDLLEEVQGDPSASKYITKIISRGEDACCLETFLFRITNKYRGKSEHTQEQL